MDCDLHPPWSTIPKEGDNSRSLSICSERPLKLGASLDKMRLHESQTTFPNCMFPVGEASFPALSHQAFFNILNKNIPIGGFQVTVRFAIDVTFFSESKPHRCHHVGTATGSRSHGPPATALHLPHYLQGSVIRFIRS